jgi:hypothetical protein
MRDTVVFRWLAAGDAGEHELFDELLHADATVHAPAGLSTSSLEEEKEAVITHLRDGKVIEAWEIADIAALRDQVSG